MKISTITLNSGTAPVIKTGCYIQQLTKIPKFSTYQLASYTNCLGTLAKNTITITFFLNRRCLFKYQISKKEISLTFLIITSILSNCQILKATYDYNTLVTLTLFVLELLKLLSTTLLLVNTD